MLKKEPFKQVRHSLTRLKAIDSPASGQEKQRAGALRSTIYQRISQHTGKVMLLMSIVLIVGTVSLMLKRQSIGRRQERISTEQLLNSAKKLGHALTQPIISGMGQRLDMLTLEEKLAQIIHKDSLTSVDSAFLWQLNAYLNKASFFQTSPRRASPPVDTPHWTYPPVDTAPVDTARRIIPPNDSIKQIP